MYYPFLPPSPLVLKFEVDSSRNPGPKKTFNVEGGSESTGLYFPPLDFVAPG
jgi:hypothetical protein